MRLQVSRSLSIVMGQFLLNLFLASWLYDEYVHNPFMQQYLAGFWTTSSAMISIALVLAGIIAGGTYLVAWRRHGLEMLQEPSRAALASDAGSLGGLRVLDVCPVCNVPLKALSETRFQCRKCRRYFKK